MAFLHKKPLWKFGLSIIKDNLSIISVICINFIIFIIHTAMYCKLFLIHSQISSLEWALILKNKQKAKPKMWSQNTQNLKTPNQTNHQKAPKKSSPHRHPSFLFFCRWRGLHFYQSNTALDGSKFPAAGLESSNNTEF